MGTRPGERPVVMQGPPQPRPEQAQRPPKDIPFNMPAITGVRPITECSCGRSVLPGMRFCDACGRPLSYTGKTERLG